MVIPLPHFPLLVAAHGNKDRNGECSSQAPDHNPNNRSRARGCRCVSFLLNATFGATIPVVPALAANRSGHISFVFQRVGEGIQ